MTELCLPYRGKSKAKEVLRSFVRPALVVAALRLVAAKVAIADHVAGECLRVRDELPKGVYHLKLREIDRCQPQ